MFRQKKQTEDSTNLFALKIPSCRQRFVVNILETLILMKNKLVFRMTPVYECVCESERGREREKERQNFILL